MAWHKTDTGVIDHPKLIVAAADLEIKPVYLLGHLIAMWLRARDKYEDGDLSRLNNAMIAGLADWNIKTADRFVQALREHRWLDGNLIHDWLDYAGEYLVKKYKTSNRKRLVEIWAKYGRIYGDTQGSNKEAAPLPKGIEQEQTRKQLGTEQEHQDIDIDQKTTETHTPACARDRGDEGDGLPGPDPPKVPPAIPDAVFDYAVNVLGWLTPDVPLKSLLADYPAAWVGLAMRKLATYEKSRRNPRYLRGILRGYQENGGPEDDNGSTARRSRDRANPAATRARTREEPDYSDVETGARL